MPEKRLCRSVFDMCFWWNEINQLPLHDRKRKTRMKKLLSLPPNLVGCFHDITGCSRDEWFCTNDPVGHKLGSGGGTSWLLQQAFQNCTSETSTSKGETLTERERRERFMTWLGQEKRILLHAGGQSRRLPAYAPSGKVLTPIPVFRWERGQRLSQDLLSLQVPSMSASWQLLPTICTRWW